MHKITQFWSSADQCEYVRAHWWDQRGHYSTKTCYTFGEAMDFIALCKLKRP